MPSLVTPELLAALSEAKVRHGELRLARHLSDNSLRCVQTAADASAALSCVTADNSPTFMLELCLAATEVRFRSTLHVRTSLTR